MADPVHLLINVFIVICVRKDHFRAHKGFQQLIAQAFRHAPLLQNQDRPHADLSGSRSCQHRMIGLCASSRKNKLRALRFCFSEQVFKLPHLVAAEPQPGQIISFYIDICF